MIRRTAPPTAAVIFALGTVYVVWGSTYLGIAVMIRSLPPLLAAGVRYVVAGGLLLGFLWLRGRVRARRQGAAAQLEPITRRHWRSALIIGTLLLMGGNGFVVLSEQRIPSGIAAIMVATMPIWIAVMDGVVTGRRPSLLALGGLVAGIVGVAILIAPVKGIAGLDPLGIGLAAFAPMCWAAGSIYARGAVMPRSHFVGSAIEMVCGGAVLFGAGMLTGELAHANPATFGADSLAALAYLIVFGSILAFSAFAWLLANVPTSTVATYAYVNPIVAVALGALVLNEPITLRTLIASAVIIAAVVAMVSGRPRGAHDDARPADSRMADDRAA
ncbi:MAG: EamA family transporter [Chloroflexota bacterium]|nr:EamA family transporter [Chloroflexota bacterium]